MPAVKEIKIASAKICEEYFTSIDTTSDHHVDRVNTSRVEINTSGVSKYIHVRSFLREVQQAVFILLMFGWSEVRTSDFFLRWPSFRKSR